MRRSRPIYCQSHGVQSMDNCFARQVVLLCSLDAVMRRDPELAGRQLLHLANGRRLASLCEQLHWPMLQVR